MKLVAFAVLLLVQDAPESASIRLRVGIVGGVKPPTVTLAIDIVFAKDEATVRQTKLVDGKEVVTTGKMTSKEFEALLKAIDPIWKLPVEDPVASEDIYGLDTGVTVERGRRRWANSAPGGCGHGLSKTRPTADQKKALANIVEAIRKEAAAKATTPGQ